MDRRRFLLACGAVLLEMGRPRLLPAAVRVFLRPGPRPRIALIIDDIGESRSRAEQFLRLSTPITYAVLPRLASSQSLAREIHDSGHQVLLHQPMEPVSASIDPGPGAIYVRDDPGRIERILEENLSSLAEASGVNNHMGSRFTADAEKMRVALETIRETGLFFVDSVTCARSAGFTTARRMNLPTAKRNVFLDNVREESAIFEQLVHLARKAWVEGNAIGIGHPFPETARAIERFTRNPVFSCLEPVYVSALLEPSEGDFPSKSLCSSASRRICHTPPRDSLA